LAVDEQARGAFCRREIAPSGIAAKRMKTAARSARADAL
jgi:hypothetical protein